MVRRERVHIFCSWVFLTLWQCQPHFTSASYPGTTAAQWTLYSGLSLSWNEASEFCKSLGGHLPVLNTTVKASGFNSTAKKWSASGQLTQDAWTGLYTPTFGKDPNIWEAECTLQPDGLNFFAPRDPSYWYYILCVRYGLNSTKLHTSLCSAPYSVICEFDKGDCRKQLLSLSRINTTLTAVSLTTSTADGCWEECMNDPHTSAAKECVGACSACSLLTQCACKYYLSDALLTFANITPAPGLLTYYSTLLKDCFNESVNNCYTSYSYVNKNTMPRPAGDPCNNGSVTAIVPNPTNAACFFPFPVPATQQQAVAMKTTQAASEQPSTEHESETWPSSTEKLTTGSKVDTTATTGEPTAGTTTETTGQTTKEGPTKEGFSPAVSPTLAATTSSPPRDAALTTEGTRTLAETTENILISQDDASTARYTSISEKDNRASGAAITDPSTAPVTDVIKYGLSTDVTFSTKDSRPMLCACMKSRNNLSLTQHATTLHRNTTSRYRRMRQSEWGSPSVLMSTGSTVFVAFTAIVGVLFLACDVHLLANLCHKTRRITGLIPSG